MVSLTRKFLEERFAPHVPTGIHRHVEPGRLPTLLSSAQRDYGRSDNVKAAWGRLFEAIGLDPATIARDRLIVRFQPPVARGESAQ